MNLDPPSIGNKRRRKAATDVWPDHQTEALISIFGKVYLAKSTGNLRPKDWTQIQEAYNEWCLQTNNQLKSKKQLHDKADNMKKKFRAEEIAEDSKGGTTSRWKWFSLFKDILGEDSKHGGVLNGMDGSKLIHHEREKDEPIILDTQCPVKPSTSMLDDTNLQADTVDQEIQQSTPPQTTNGTSATRVIDLEATTIISLVTEACKVAGVHVEVKHVSAKKKTGSTRDLSDLRSCMKDFAELFASVADRQIEANSRLQLEIAKLIFGVNGNTQGGPSSE